MDKSKLAIFGYSEILDNLYLYLLVSVSGTRLLKPLISDVICIREDLFGLKLLGTL